MLSLWDLSDQFQQIALDMLQMLFFEREAQTEGSIAQQLLYCLVIMSDYFKYNGRRGTQQSIRLIAAQIIERFEKILEDSEFVTGIYISCLTGATSEPARQYWISKIVSVINTNGIRLRNNFLFTFAYAFSALKASQCGPSMLTHLMGKLDQAQAELNQFVALMARQNPLVNDHVAFYNSWIQVLKAEILHRQGKKDESLSWIQQTCLSFNVIQSDALRAQLRGLVKFCVTVEREVPAQLQVFHTLANWLGITEAIAGSAAPAAPDMPPMSPLSQHQPDNFYSEILSKEGQYSANIPVPLEELSDSADPASATSPIPLSGDEMMDTSPVDNNDVLFSIFGPNSTLGLGGSMEIPQFSEEPPIAENPDDLLHAFQEQTYSSRNSTGTAILQESRVTCL